MHLLLFLTGDIVHEEKRQILASQVELLVQNSSKSGFVAHALGYFESETHNMAGVSQGNASPDNSINCKYTPKQTDLCFCIMFPTANGKVEVGY